MSRFPGITQIASHDFGEPSGKAEFIAEYVPPIVCCFLANLTHCSNFLRSSVVSAIICSIVDNNPDYINLMSPILAPERVERIIQQWKPDSGEKLRPHGNQYIARRVIRGLCEYRFSGGAIDYDEVRILKMVSDKSR